MERLERSKKIIKTFEKTFKKVLTNKKHCDILIPVARETNPSDRVNGSIAQLGEHLPYKQRVIGSSPIVPTTASCRFQWGITRCPYGPVVQLVRTLACHARGRGFEPHSGRQLCASVAQSVEQGTENPRVVGSIPTGGTTI